jgi:glyoxylase-like metal-dependent hydrolase (beta-lactamase superfamily II)
MENLTLLMPRSQNECNAYLVKTADNEFVLIDAPFQAVEAVRELTGGKLDKIILTHGHFDHIGGLQEVVKLTGADVFIHEADAPMLTDTRLSLADYAYGAGFPVYDGAVNFIKDGENVAGMRIFNSPGHTPGLVYIQYNDTIFTGDFIFEGSIGNTSFPNSNPTDMEKSLKRFAEDFGDTDYTLLPGHGESTTVQRELQNNPFIKGIR